jgi:hypothetical protein
MIRTQTTVVVGRVNALDAGLYNFACILHSTSIRINLLEPVFFFCEKDGTWNCTCMDDDISYHRTEFSRGSETVKKMIPVGDKHLRRQEKPRGNLISVSLSSPSLSLPVHGF